MNTTERLSEIEQQKQALEQLRRNLDGLRKYEDHLMQGIQTNRFNIKDVEDEIFQVHNNILYLINEVAKSLTPKV